jgi:hypothetical protein
MIVKCKCGYEWDYKGKLQRPTCPSCKNAVFEVKSDNQDIG